MNYCFSTLFNLVDNGQSCVLVTVAHIAGSAPREAGARMIVTPERIFGTIGGGNLEFEAIQIARARLDDSPATGSPRFVELFPLGPMLQQCCGGAVFLHFEVLRDGQHSWLAVARENEQNNTPTLLASRIAQDDPAPSHRHFRENRVTTQGGAVDEAGNGNPVAVKTVITEAGVIGSSGDKNLDELALAKAGRLLSGDKVTAMALLHSLVDTQLTLPDMSDALFFEMIFPCDFQVVLFGAGHVGRALVNTLSSAVACRITWIDSRAEQFPETAPANVERRLTADPLAEIDDLPPDMYCLVMTHNHQLDQDICEAVLRRSEFTYLGLIGSAAKYRRFTQRLKEKGITGKQLDRLTCPIGIPGIESKQPGAIAVSVTAQLLQLYEQRQTGGQARVEA